MKVVYLNPFLKKFQKLKNKKVLLIAFIAFLFGLSFYLSLPQHIYTLAADQNRLVPIYYVDTPEKTVAISFDACWGADHTPKILKTLKDHGIKTTFFLTGYWLEKYPDMVKRISDDGHEIGNHTYTHPHHNKHSEAGVRKEIERTHQLIKEISGQEANLFRPPFGEYSNKVIQTIEGCGYKVIQWSIDSLDWKEIGKDALVKRVTEGLHEGAIVLFHNNGQYTAEALPEIIEYFKEEGYEIVPISELIYQHNYYIDPHSGAQKKSISSDN